MKSTTTYKDNFSLRFAQEEDIPTILAFIRELAEYEHMSDQVTATEEILMNSIFVQKKAEVLIGEYNEQPVAFALFFHNFSTFLGKPGIYLEDLYVKKEVRKKGFGSIILSHLAKLAKERNCGRLEWACLDWNEPSIQFYKQLGSSVMDEWTVYRLTDKSLDQMANRYSPCS